MCDSYEIEHQRNIDLMQYFEMLHLYKSKSKLERITEFMDPEIIKQIENYCNEKEYDIEEVLIVFYNEYIKREVKNTGKIIPLATQYTFFEKLKLNHSFTLDEERDFL